MKSSQVYLASLRWSTYMWHWPRSQFVWNGQGMALHPHRHN